jgi:hypothetical protein
VGLLKWFIITEKLDSKQRVTRYQLLNGDSSIMIHSRDEFGNEEIISSALVEPETWHTTHMIKPYDGVWATYVDSLDSDAQIDGKYPSKNLISNWRFEELKEFSYVHSAL